VSRRRGRGYRLRIRNHGLDPDLHNLGYEGAAVVRTRTAEVGEGGHHLEFKLTTHSNDYAVHLIHPVGTRHFEGENLGAGREISKEEHGSGFEDDDQQ